MTTKHRQHDPIAAPTMTAMPSMGARRGSLEVVGLCVGGTVGIALDVLTGRACVVAMAVLARGAVVGVSVGRRREGCWLVDVLEGSVDWRVG